MMGLPANKPLCRIDYAPSCRCILDPTTSDRERPVVNLSEMRPTSFCHPLLSFFSSPARIDATPVLYEKSREKYRKKSMSLGEALMRRRALHVIEDRFTIPPRFLYLASAIVVSEVLCHRKTCVHTPFRHIRAHPGMLTDQTLYPFKWVSSCVGIVHEHQGSRSNLQQTYLRDGT